MSTREEEYELGRDITHLARGTARNGTGVISVRLDVADIARLEEIGRGSGKTVSQVVRDAISAYRVKTPEMIVGVWSGSTLITGDSAEVSGNIGWQVTYSGSQLNSTRTSVPIELPA